MSSLDRMLSILDLFDENRMNIQLDHAIRATGASRATAYRYIQSLCNRGLLAPAAGGSYVLGSRIIELDRLVRKVDPLLRSASPMILTASVRLGINIMLCSFYGDKVMCADLAWPDRSIDEIYERGRPMPFFHGAMAKIILANLTPYQLRSLMLWQAEHIRQAGLGDDWDAFRTHMARLRKAGFCVTIGEVFSGLVGISAPVFDAEHRVLGSVVLIVPEKRYKKGPAEPYQIEIVALAAEITRDIEKRTKKDQGGAGRAARPHKTRRGKGSRENALA